MSKEEVLSLIKKENIKARKQKTMNKLSKIVVQAPNFEIYQCDKMEVFTNLLKNIKTRNVLIPMNMSLNVKTYLFYQKGSDMFQNIQEINITI